MIHVFSWLAGITPADILICIIVGLAVAGTIYLDINLDEIDWPDDWD